MPEPSSPPAGPRRSDLAALLARAFHDDPILASVVPDVGRRDHALRFVFAAHLRYAEIHGQIDSAPGAPEAAAPAGAAIWVAPDLVPMTFPGMIRSGHALLPLRLGARAWSRLARFNDYALMLHRRTAPGPHWYLHAIGVDPPRQRQGVGRALLARGLERADRSHLPCYLETANERTLPLYESCGFRTEIRGRVPPDGPPIWAMLRPARRRAP